MKRNQHLGSLSPYIELVEVRDIVDGVSHYLPKDGVLSV